MRKSLRVALIALITILLLALFLRNSDPGEILRALADVSLPWFVLALMTNFTALLLRTARWRTILTATGRRPPLYDTFLSTAIGFMSSAILPVRAGDLIRPALLSRRTGTRFSTTLATVVSERIIDLVAVLTMVIVFALAGLGTLSDDPATARKAILIPTAATVAAMGLAALVALIVVVYFFREGSRRLQHRVAALLPKRFRRGWINFFDTLAAAVAIVGRPSVFARVVLLTAGIWACLTGQLILVLHAIGRPLPYIASFLVTGMTILGLWIPTPGGVGGFHKAAQMALTNFYGFDVNSSIVAALIFHIVGTMPVIATGLVLFVREGLSLRQLARLGETAAGEAGRAPAER